MVLVTTSPDANRVFPVPVVDANGDLRVGIGSTLLEANPLEKSLYRFDLISKRGIKSIEGIPIATRFPVGDFSRL